MKGLIRQQNGFEILVDNKKLDIKFTDKSALTEMTLMKGYHDFEFRYIKDFKDGTLLLDLVGRKYSHFRSVDPKIDDQQSHRQSE